MYANDTILMMTGNNLDELERRMNRKLEQISELCRFNGLSFPANGLDSTDRETELRYTSVDNI